MELRGGVIGWSYRGGVRGGVIGVELGVEL